MTHDMQQPTTSKPDPRSEIWRQGDVWVAVGRPMTGLGAVKVRLTPHLLFWEKGTLRTDAQQIPLAHVHDVDATQSMTQKMRGVGDIRLHVARPGRMEIVLLTDLAEFREGVDQINHYAAQARLHESQIRNTQTIQHQQQYQPQATQPVQPAMSAASEPDVYAQLEKLGGLRDKGFISPEDYEAKKTELLARL
jgi:hypothetical protein